MFRQKAQSVSEFASIIRAIALMMEATSTSETSVNLCQITLRNNPADINLHIRLSENLRSHRNEVSVFHSKDARLDPERRPIMSKNLPLSFHRIQHGLAYSVIDSSWVKLKNSSPFPILPFRTYVVDKESSNK
jgi:hypothetical protein